MSSAAADARSFDEDCLSALGAAYLRALGDAADAVDLGFAIRPPR